MTENKLLLNSDKKEAMLTGTKSKLSSVYASSLQLDSADIPLCDQVRSLGVMLDSTLPMQPSNNLFYFEIRWGVFNFAVSPLFDASCPKTHLQNVSLLSSFHVSTIAILFLPAPPRLLSKHFNGFKTVQPA